MSKTKYGLNEAVVKMNQQEMPWSFYAAIVSFGIFFTSLNIYLLTKILAHPWSSDLWLIGVVLGIILLVYSYRMVRIHQRELIEKRKAEQIDTR